jgi:putative ABC transport system permease protein
MFNYVYRILKAQPFRLILTICGISLCIVLMLFLLAVYQGVKDGSVEYIRENKTDLWVMQENAWNILRGSSLLSTGHGILLEEIPVVKTAAPVLFILSGVRKSDKVATIFLTGYRPETGLGGPPHIMAGRNIENDQEIVLDKSFARKYGFTIGDRVRIRGDSLNVVGLSSGTNAFVIQYAFADLRRVQNIIGFPSLVTCFLVKLNPGYSTKEAITQIHEELPGVSVFDHPTFLRNNIREMESGFLPLLYTVAFIGVIVLTAVLSLLLSINILERRLDYAVLKTLGSPDGFLRGLVLNQGFILAGASFVAAIWLFFPLNFMVQEIVPEISLRPNVLQLIITASGVGVMSVVSAYLAIGKLNHIYPMEAFL